MRPAAAPNAAASSAPTLVIAAAPTELLDRPLEFLFAEHLRHRALCARLRRIAEAGDVARAEADAIRHFLTDDLDLHDRDEAENLRPALIRRMLVEDHLEPVLGRLAAEHAGLAPMRTRIADMLAPGAPAAAVALDPEDASLIERFAVTMHRALAIENGIVLVLARKRLTSLDLDRMSEAMKARRKEAA